MREFNKRVGDTVRTVLGIVPLEIVQISKDRPYPWVRVRSRWTGRSKVFASYELSDFHVADEEPRW